MEHAVAGVPTDITGLRTSMGDQELTGKAFGEAKNTDFGAAGEVLLTPQEGDCPKDETSDRLSNSPLHLLRKQELKNEDTL